MTRAFWTRRGIMALCILAAAGTSWSLTQRSGSAVKIAKQLPYYNQIGSFELTGQNHQTVTADSLLGKVWIADFIFTRCGGPCPRMTNQMKKLQDSIDAANINFVSFSVDPEYDTPGRLKVYADKFKADDARWFFLTGDREQIYKLSIQHFLLGVDEIPEEEREQLDQGFNHSTKFALVDKQGQIRGYFDSEDAASMALLTKQARALSEVK